MALDAGGNLLEEGAVALGPPGGADAAWIGFSRPTADIAKIVVQPDQSLPSGDDYVIDNIFYNMQAFKDDPGGFLHTGEERCLRIPRSRWRDQSNRVDKSGEGWL